MEECCIQFASDSHFVDRTIHKNCFKGCKARVRVCSRVLLLRPYKHVILASSVHLILHRVAPILFFWGPPEALLAPPLLECPVGEALSLGDLGHALCAYLSIIRTPCGTTLKSHETAESFRASSYTPCDHVTSHRNTGSRRRLG